MLPADGPSIPSPRAVHSADDELFVLDKAGRVLVYNENGELQRQWWMPDYSIGKPEKIIKLEDGRLAVADTHYHRVVFFDATGEVAGMFGSLGHEPGQFIYPVAVAEDSDRNLYVAEYGDNDRVQKFSPEGEFILQFGCPGTKPGEFQRPSGMIWHDGRLYVVDAFNNRIQVFSDSGEFQQVLGGDEGTLHYPYDIALSSKDELFVVEYASGRVSKFNLQGELVGRYGTLGSSEGQFSTPWGMTISRGGTVFVADTGNRRMVKLE
jgi:DNA-binding beta-propeller fold protein YncE